MISVPEGQIKEILRPGTSEELDRKNVSKVKQLATSADVTNT